MLITKNKVMKRNNLITGALILSLGGIMAKIFSSIYRIVLTRILGGVGIGLYQLVFPTGIISSTSRKRNSRSS